MVAEVYPAFKGAKNLTSFGELVDLLLKAVPWLNLAGCESDSRSCDHALGRGRGADRPRSHTGPVTVPALDQLDAARRADWLVVFLGR